MDEMETESLEQQLKVRKILEEISLSRAVRSESPSLSVLCFMLMTCL